MSIHLTDEEAADFQDECDRVGVPYNAAGLVRHHVGNTAMLWGTHLYMIKILLEQGKVEEAIQHIDNLRGAEAKAALGKAWDEGYDAGWSDMHNAEYDAETTTVNPYID